MFMRFANRLALFLLTVISVIAPAVAGNPPVITNSPDSLVGGHCDTIRYDFEATDPEGDSLWFKMSYGVGSIDPVTGEFSYKPSMDDVGLRVPAAIQVCDTSGCSDTVVFVILAGNESPSFISSCDTTVYGVEGEAAAYYLSINDPDTCDEPATFVSSVEPEPSGQYFLDQGAGGLVFVPDILDIGEVFQFIIAATDSRDTALCSVSVAVGSSRVPVVGLDTISGLEWGDSTELSIYIENTDIQFGGFDVSIGFDSNVVAIDEVLQGQLLTDCGWELFSHQILPGSDCGATCPNTILRIVTIAEIDNGTSHPSCYGPPDTLRHELARIKLHVKNDMNIAAGDYPFKFQWNNCSDNLFASLTGDYALCDMMVYDWNDALLWDETDDDGYPEYLRPPATGTADSCFVTEAVRLVVFKQGRTGVDVPGCCGLYNGGRTGNTDCDVSGEVGLNDVTRLIDRVYISHQKLCCEKNGNVDGVGEINLSDITRLIDHVYISGSGTAVCQ